MSDFVPKPKMVYDDSITAYEDVPDGYPYGLRKSSDMKQAVQALISIANSLAILADESDEMTPIVHAAFIVGDAMNADPPEGAIVPGKEKAS